MEETKEGGVRRLTIGEVELAKSVFGTTIQYDKIWIHKESYLPFNLQGELYAMTPNGEIYLRTTLYRDDFSLVVDDMQHLFIHEIGHIWQREKGMNVIVRGLASLLVSYRYKLDGRLLSEYPMEQQAQVIADNFILQKFGYKAWYFLWAKKDPSVTLDGDISESIIRPQYKKSLRGFPW